VLRSHERRQSDRLPELDRAQSTDLRHQGRSWAEITRETGVTKGTAQKALASLPRTPVAATSPSA
jgi:hypothetical protein